MSLESVVKVLSILNSCSTAGPDYLHTYLLKACSPAALSLPFCRLFVKSLDEEVLPDLWKTSIVASLYKNDSRCDPLTYRL